MKFLIFALALFAVASAQTHHEGHHQPIAILRQAQDISPDGSFNFGYETENGIAVSASGAPGPVNADGQSTIVSQGQFQYTSPDGTPIAVTYIANENGFQPQGAHLPIAPPVPVLIQRAIDYIAAHPSKEQQQQQPSVPRFQTVFDPVVRPQIVPIRRF